MQKFNPEDPLLVLNPNYKLFYRERVYKYQVLKEYTSYIGLLGYNIDSLKYRLRPNGYFTIKVLVAWDGASGPTWDDETNIVPSLNHDGIYELIRMRLLPPEVEEYADDLLAFQMEQRGASDFRCKYYHDGVAIFGEGSCKPGSNDIDVKESV